MPKDKDEMPILQRIDVHEAQSIKEMFDLLAVDRSGRISQHHAHKLLMALGLEMHIENLPMQLTLKDLLLHADSVAPEEGPEGGAKTLNCLISQDGDGSPSGITPAKVVAFAKKLNRPPPSMSEATVYVSTLVDYDDCESEPEASPAVFQKEIVKFCKLHGIDAD
eukprot:CAMPEP_0185027760 /NCGR_PEP_ID=MMETSP1103-20130426/12966_1 /TAXON_ID=36769 /ORGANISM="Paraphysomonas bandaiensis, Strain Caron Lab Isolate" /LENGTH=164 /DNA_ID=CAMNT_0027561873 /DNA_START=99 /DNA_END=590 /DNA_ORIENTATION=-